MKRVVFSYLAAAIMLAFVVSCNKDEDEGKGGKVQLLETVSEDGVLGLKYEYDDQNRMEKMIIYEEDGNTVYSTKTFSYDNAGNLISISYVYVNEPRYNRTDNFTNDGNKIIINETDTETQEYLELNTQGLPVKWVYENSNGLETKTMEYDNNGNLSMWKSVYSHSYEEANYTQTYIYAFTYDSKKAPLYNCKTPTWAFIWEDDFGFLDQEGTNKNNLLTISDAGEDPNKSFAYTYDNDFPTSVIVKWEDDGDTETYTFTYIKK